MIAFRLAPFPGEPAPAGISLDGSLARTGARIEASFRLAAPPGAIVVPPPAPTPARREGLWRSTCVELFLAARGEPAYLEVNLAPSGDWDVYSFDRYRDGMARLDPARIEPRRAATGDDHVTTLGFALLLPDPLAVAPALDLSATAVVEHGDGARTHWAAAHRGERPDFHLRASFVLSL